MASSAKNTTHKNKGLDTSIFIIKEKKNGGKVKVSSF